MDSTKHLVLLVKTNGEIFDKEMSNKIEVENILDKLISKNQAYNYDLVITIDWQGYVRIKKINKIINFLVIVTSGIDNLENELVDNGYSLDMNLIYNLFDKHKIVKHPDLHKKLDELKSDCAHSLIRTYDNDTKKLMRIFNADSSFYNFEPHIESWLDYHTSITLKDFKDQDINFIEEVIDQLYLEITTKNIEL